MNFLCEVEYGVGKMSTAAVANPILVAGENELKVSVVRLIFFLADSCYIEPV